MLWQRALSQSPCGVRMLIECNHRNPRGLAQGSSQARTLLEAKKNEEEKLVALQKTYDMTAANADNMQAIWYLPVQHPSYIYVYKRKEAEKYVEKVAEAIGRISANDVCTIFNVVMNTASEKIVKKNKKI